eukprot:TRINITY_DN3858_c0_g1_i1.p1 TRINITY_DN3858_c0_g1~~TRINITY_DN3858_c0_g1_i1.p1  ORF type:complete len:361 (+),score=118.34 TRINITY_DN3858_c0_g1_i1:195-1277(+)
MDLIDACAAGDFKRVDALLNDGANVYFERDTDGWTALTVASALGHTEIVLRLLGEAAPWNAVDKQGLTAAQHAKQNGFDELYTVLLDHAVRTELIMSVLDRHAAAAAAGDDREEEEQEEEEGAAAGQHEEEEEEEAKAEAPLPSNHEYLKSKLVYNDGKLLDDTGDAVMMTWETPLMEKHAELLNVTGRRVLNIGFGMGIIDTAIQKLNPASHTIVEAHPDVFKHMMDQGWHEKTGVRLVFGRWQDVLDQLEPCGYDAVYFDTYGEFYDDMREFHEALLDLLTPMTGVYSFFNGLAAKNEFFHDVYCKIVELELQHLGLQTAWTQIAIDPSSDGSNTWDGVRRTYWTLKQYNLPTCTFML